MKILPNFLALSFLLSVFIPVAKGEIDLKTYRGIYHVHTQYSHDSKTSLSSVIKSAQKRDLDFVVITDHNNRKGELIYEKMDKAQKPILIFGEEISAPDGHMIALGANEEAPKNLTSQQYIDWIHSKGGYAMLAHPVCIKNPWRNWSVTGFDGMEVYNFAHAFYPTGKVLTGIRAWVTPNQAFLKSFLPGKDLEFEVWDQKNVISKVAGVGAIDSHQHFKFAGLSFEDLDLQFSAATMYVQVSNLTAQQIVHAIGTGKSYLTFEAFGRADGFSAEIVSSEGSQKLRVTSPFEAEIQIYHDGKLLKSEIAPFLEVPMSGGVYRAQVYRNRKLWIISNPIFTEAL